MKLSDKKHGANLIVKSINCDVQTKKQLERIGLTEGVKVIYIRSAPLFDPIEIKVRDFYLAIRKEIADKIIVIDE